MDFDLKKRICYYFNEISNIPRGSGNEKGISDYIVSFAKEHGLSYEQDELFNVIVHKPASTGYENAEDVMLQGHIDMVCEKNQDVEHDFEKDPLDLYVEDGWLKARGTTLGADDGYGVSYMLAILEDTSLKHPPLHCYFTVMEEIGLVGASHLKKDQLCGRRYINLDGGGEVVTCVSSAGGARAEIHIPAEWEENSLPAYRLSVRGLSGGHSGGKIHLERGNANILAARIMKELQAKGIDLWIVNIEGGLKYNAIPRECDIVFASAADKKAIETMIRESEKNIQAELEFSDNGFYVLFAETEAKQRMIKKHSDALVDYLFLMPNGFVHKSMAIEGLTTASLNAGVIRTNQDEIVIQDLIRSALSSHTDELLMKLETLGRLFGITVQVGERYGGWSYSESSELRDKLRDVLKRHDIEMKERATHGGLECGIFKALDPNLDIITYGPIATGEHTPDEQLDLASFDRSYQVLCELLAELH